MSEQQMRQRVFCFLRARMRNMIMPATVGIGLAVAGGCSDSSVTPVYSAPNYNDAAAVKQDVPASPDLASADTARPDSPVIPDVAADSSPDVPTPPDTAPSDAVASEAGLDTRRIDSQGDVPWVKYGSPFDGGILDAQTEAGQIITKYIAPIPDAAVDTSDPVTRYMASMPDASPDPFPAPLYMAPRPS